MFCGGAWEQVYGSCMNLSKTRMYSDTLLVCVTIVNGSTLSNGLAYMQINSTGLGQHPGQSVLGYAVPGHHQLHDSAACGLHRAQHHVQGKGFWHVPRAALCPGPVLH